jgi:uncharacterized protein
VETRFLADNNVGKLARWLRVLGYDAVLFRQLDDRQMIRTALDEQRVILTKDAELGKRRLVSDGTLRVILVEEDDPELQVRDVIRTLNLDCEYRPFSLCLECNQPLTVRDREEVRDLVPLHVLATQTEYRQCPACQRIYWQGTHWRAMVEKLRALQAWHEDSRAG